jgi:N-acetylglucosamine-6-phosphate deacetylase
VSSAASTFDREDFMPEQLLILAGAEVFLPDGSYAPGTVVVAEGQIVELLDFALPDQRDGSTYVNLSGAYLTAGFIELRGPVVSPGISAAGFHALAADAARHGITAVMPRVPPCDADALRGILSAFHEAATYPRAGCARLLPLRCIGNFLNPQYAPREFGSGAFYTPEDPRGRAVLDVLAGATGDVALVTLAPELPGALNAIARLVDARIHVSLGSSAADYDQAIAALDAGATHVTDLFRAMPPFDLRAPGLAGTALEQDDLFVELLADAASVHPAIVSMVIAAKGADRTLPAMPDGTPADAVRYLVDAVDWDLGEALSMVAASPAGLLGGTNFGSINYGAVADLTILDQNLQPRSTLVGGVTVWNRS